jgi:hypothetical protein
MVLQFAPMCAPAIAAAAATAAVAPDTTPSAAPTARGEFETAAGVAPAAAGASAAAFDLPGGPQDLLNAALLVAADPRTDGPTRRVAAGVALWVCCDEWCGAVVDTRSVARRAVRMMGGSSGEVQEAAEQLLWGLVCCPGTLGEVRRRAHGSCLALAWKLPGTTCVQCCVVGVAGRCRSELAGSLVAPSVPHSLRQHALASCKLV